MKQSARSASYWLQVLGLAGIYFLAAQVRLLVAFGGEQVAPIWLPAGIALAALLAFGMRMWPGIVLGQLAVVLFDREPLLASMGVTAGNTLQALLPAYLLRRFFRFDNRLARLRDVRGLVLLAALLSTFIGATVGVYTIALTLPDPEPAFARMWMVYWLGNVLGVLVVTPLLLTWPAWREQLRGLGRVLEVGVLLICVNYVDRLAFGTWAPTQPRSVGLEYAVFPMVMWAALRFGPAGAAAVSFAVSSYSIIGTFAGYGPFVGDDLKIAVVLLQSFLAVAAVTGLALAATTAERRSAQQEVEGSRERLRNLTTRLESIREDERKRIAREIHDQLGQTLTVLKVDLTLLGQHRPDGPQLLERTESMAKLVDSGIDTVRRLSSELRPRVLDDLGLAAAVEWQAEEFQKRTGIDCQVKISPRRISIDQDRSTATFRIFQEALTNVARHAAASKLLVELTQKQDCIQLRVQDNGKGIAKEKLLDPKASGLVGMRERVHPWHGEVRVQAAPDRGTEVVVRIPLAGTPAL